MFNGKWKNDKICKKTKFLFFARIKNKKLKKYKDGKGLLNVLPNM